MPALPAPHLPASDLPWCGAPATPLDLWTRWTFDPALIAGLLAALTLYELRRPRAARPAAFRAGWAVAAAAFVTPLCALSIALFSARLGQHLILTLVAAPLLARGLGPLRAPALPAAAGFAALFWFWHAPAPYAATLANDAIYWSMHLSLLGAAILLWSALLHADGPALGPASLAAVATAAQMSGLSALMLFSPRAWHVWHEAAAAPWGLSALADQQLGAALTWVAGGLVMSAVAGFGVARWVGGAAARPAP